MCALRTFWRAGLWLLLALVSIAFFGPQVSAQDANDYPNRTIRIIVGFTPGGAPDVTARVLAQSLQEQWKQPVVVENRPGAGSAIAAQYVASAAPDGYTLMSITNAHAVAPAINPRLGYDALKDFAAGHDDIVGSEVDSGVAHARREDAEGSGRARQAEAE